MMRTLLSAGRYLRQAISRELNQLSYNSQALVPLGAPEVFQIELTNHCPMSCIMCPRTQNMTRPLGYMDVELFQTIVRQIAPTSSKIFLHHFGDSLVHPQLGEFIRFADRHRIATYLSTNPILLTDDRIHELVDSGLHELVISLDGYTNATSSVIRGRAAANVEEAERRILALVDYRRQRRSKKPHLIMQFVRQRLNQHEAAQWLAKWSTVEGIDAVKLKSYVTWDGGDERINELRINTSTDAEVVCDKPWTSVTILWDGRVVPCCFDYDGLYVLGSLLEHSLQQIWSGEKARALRKSHREQTLASVRLCAKCTDKEGYRPNIWRYPFNRLSGRTPLGGQDNVSSG
jgi:radical SAM protein with 4Fe4S-binding SPASM domain